MNKAFVKEDDDREPRCPQPEGCGGPGIVVPPDTVAAQASEAAATALSDDVLYCVDPTCGVGYFDPWGATIPAATLASLSWPKDPTAPLCPCFGLTREDVVEDAQRKDTSRLRDLIAKSEGPDATCATLAPDGRCCVTEARRLYLRNLQPDPEE